MPAESGRRGRFTLLEMLLVMTILAIVLGMALPALGRKSFTLLQREADASLAGACNWASAVALRTGSPVELRWESGDDRVRLRPLPAAGGREKGIAPADIKEFRVPSEVVPEPGSADKTGWRCVFHPGGGATGEPLPVLIRGELFELRVGKLTGHGQLQKRNEP
jgi:prepilin-type N-terminal cleavage/methylation domain-containing protein